MSRWHDVLTIEQIDDQRKLTASLDPAFARSERQWYESRTDGDLRAAMRSAWLCNEDCRYPLARSYLAARGIVAA
jgi:hypothetical protein